MCRLLISISFLLITVVSTVAQNQGNVWYFGIHAGLDFSTTPPTVLTDGANDGGVACGSVTAEGAGSISDSAGNVLFYTDGTRVWDRTHNLMPNGDGLLGGVSSTQSSLIVPQPNNNEKYYLFTTDDFCNDLENGLRYSVVDLCLNNGLGDISEGEKNILLLDSAGEKLTATRHANGIDYWVMTHRYWSDKFYCYRLTESGLSTAVVSHSGQVHEPLNGSSEYSTAIGQICFSQDGAKLAIGAGNGAGILEVHEFDANSGLVSPSLDLSSSLNGSGFGGVCFSPDAEFLYASFLAIYQYDLDAGNGNSQDVSSSQVQLNPPFGTLSYRTLELGPDNRIYLSRGSEYLAVINDPNALGSASNYLDSAINLGSGFSEYGLPNFIDSYDYTATGICDTGVGIIEQTNAQPIEIYPNPTAGKVRFKLRNGVKPTGIEVYDMLGKVVMEQPYQPTIDVSALQNGNYIIAVLTEERNYRQLLVVE